MGNKINFADDGTCLFKCPGCESVHSIQVIGREPTWTWNNKYDLPTFLPSVRVTQPRFEGPCKYNNVCHFYIRSGYFLYLTDCTHHLAGQKIEMPDWNPGL